MNGLARVEIAHSRAGDRGARPGARFPAFVAMLVVAGFVVACSSTATASPTLPSNLPSLPPVSAPTSGSAACVDSTTMGIINQVQGYASEAPSILSANKDKLISGLQAFQPSDQTTATWRDEVVAALQGGDFAAAAAKIRQGVTSGITLPSC